MQILDDSSDNKIDGVTIFLTESEAFQLCSYLKQFLGKPFDKGLHFHLSSEDYKNEVTICIYDPEKINSLHPRAQKLIRDDE